MFYFIFQKKLPVLVVGELDEVPLDVLAAVLLLLHLEHELVELLLQLFVRVVDQELLEVVVLERFEPTHQPRKRREKK